MKKNKFSNVFARLLCNCLKFDSYIKSIDLSHNKIGKRELMALLDCNCVTQNASLVNLDFRYNPGTTPEVLKKTAIQLIKNIGQIK